MGEAGENKNPGQLRKDLAELEKLKRELGKDFDLKAFKDVEKNASNIKQLLKDWRNEFSEINRYIKDLGSQLREAWRDISKTERATKDIDKAFKSIVNLSDELKSDQDDIIQLSERELKSMQQKLQKNVQALTQARDELAAKKELSAKELDYFTEINSALSDEQSYFKRIEAFISARLIKEKQITQQLGLAGNAIKALGGVMDKLGVGSLLKMDEISEKMRKAAEENKGKWGVLGAGIKASFLSIGEALTDPLAILKGIYDITSKLVSLSIKYQSKQFEVASALGLSVTQAAKLQAEFQNISINSGRAWLTSKQLAEEYTKMTDQMGILAPANAEFLTTSSQLQRRIGASAESMEMLQVFAAKNGATLSQSYATVVGIGKAEAGRLKINMSEKQILEAVSKVSATIFNNFNGNLTALTKSVIEAKKMGTTLDTIAKAGDSMLDFESSISKEFEAQLLTGKDLNLSKARELALNHDTDGLMKELNSKMMSFGEYNKMNVLQQQSFAEALGLSKDQLDEIYRTQQKQNELGNLAAASQEEQYDALVKRGLKFEDISKIMGEQAAEDAKKASVQEKQAALQERIADEVGRMTEGLANAANKVLDFLGNIENLKGTLIAISSVIGGIVAYSVRQKMLAAQTAALERGKLQTKITELTLDEEGNILDTTRKVTTTEQLALDEADASAKLVSWLGPIGLGLIPVLLATLASISAGGSGGGGGASINASDTGGINPVNTNTQIPLASSTTTVGNKPIVNNNIAVYVDPISGKTLTKVMSESHTPLMDHQSGHIGEYIKN